MANFTDIEIGGILKFKDTSFLKDPSLVEKYRDTYAVVLNKDETHRTIQIKLFDGNKRWVKATRVSETFEIME